MDERTKRTQRDYTLAFKLAVVDEVEKGELTYHQAQQRYGIQGRSTVLAWLRKHGCQDWGSLRGPNQHRSDPVSKPTVPQSPSSASRNWKHSSRMQTRRPSHSKRCWK